MIIKRLLLPTLLILTGLLKAQTDFRPGYILKFEGDTLKGLIDYRGDQLMGEICNFKAIGSETVKQYYPGDIIGFRFTGSKYYLSREVDGKTVFLQFLLKGRVNLYYIRDNYGDHFYIDKDSLKICELPYFEEVRLKDDILYNYKSTKHLGILSYYMQDAPDFQKRISDIKKPEHNNLIKLAEDYHKTVCKDDKCIIFEKKLPIVKLRIDIVGGNINFTTNSGELIEKNYPTGGVLLHFWMPRSNEKLYIRTGCLISNLEFKDYNKLYYKKLFYKIPLQFEYLYPKGVFRPTFSYGWNYYKQEATTTVSGTLGFNIFINKDFSLSFCADAEYQSTFLLPAQIISYSAYAGVVIDL